METALSDIISKLAKANHEAKQGAVHTEPIKELYEDIGYLLSVIHMKNERISTLEKIIIEDRINKL